MTRPALALADVATLQSALRVWDAMFVVSFRPRDQLISHFDALAGGHQDSIPYWTVAISPLLSANPGNPRDGRGQPSASSFEFTHSLACSQLFMFTTTMGRDMYDCDLLMRTAFRTINIRRAQIDKFRKQHRERLTKQFEDMQKLRRANSEVAIAAGIGMPSASSNSSNSSTNGDSNGNGNSNGNSSTASEANASSHSSANGSTTNTQTAMSASAVQTTTATAPVAPTIATATATATASTAVGALAPESPSSPDPIAVEFHSSGSDDAGGESNPAASVPSASANARSPSPARLKPLRSQPIGALLPAETRESS